MHPKIYPSKAHSSEIFSIFSELCNDSQNHYNLILEQFPPQKKSYTFNAIFLFYSNPFHLFIGTLFIKLISWPFHESHPTVWNNTELHNAIIFAISVKDLVS